MENAVRAKKKPEIHMFHIPNETMKTKNKQTPKQFIAFGVYIYFSSIFFASSSFSCFVYFEGNRIHNSQKVMQFQYSCFFKEIFQ